MGDKRDSRGLAKRAVPIIYEDEYIIICEKPAGMPVQSDISRDLDVETYLKHRIYENQENEGEPYVSAVHRLDRPVGGLMAFARTRDVAAELSRQIQQNEFEKNYQAIVCGALPEECGSFEDYLWRDGRNNTAQVVDEGRKGAKKAVLDYELIDEIETEYGIMSWVLIMLRTGRHHQIRVQFASRGLALYGDTKYNPLFQNTKRRYVQLGLYSTRISFLHPKTGKRMTFKTEPRGEAFDRMDVEAY